MAETQEQRDKAEYDDLAEQLLKHGHSVSSVLREAATRFLGLTLKPYQEPEPEPDPEPEPEPEPQTSQDETQG